VRSNQRHRLVPRVSVSAIDGTTRVVFSPDQFHPRTSLEEAHYIVPDEVFSSWLRQAVNAIVAQGDKPSHQGLWRAYLVLVKTPLILTDRHGIKIGFPLIWSLAKPQDRAIRAHTNQKHGVVWTWFATYPLCSLPRPNESKLPLTIRIAPFLRQRYGDGVVEDLAWIAASQHFKSHGATDIVTWQRSVFHIAATGFDVRTVEFELQDFAANIIVVE
jgi:hypothetical protein